MCTHHKACPLGLLVLRLILSVFQVLSVFQALGFVRCVERNCKGTLIVWEGLCDRI